MSSGGHAVRVLTALALGLMVLGAGSGLYAVPVVRLTGGGTGSTDITAADCKVFAPGMCAELFNPVDLSNLDPTTGLGDLPIKNDLIEGGLNQTITGLDFVLPTTYFNQGFSASTIPDTAGETTIFTSAQVVFVPGPLFIGVTGGSSPQVVIPSYPAIPPPLPAIQPAIDVIFSGTGTGSGTTTAPTNPCTGPAAFAFNCQANPPAGLDAAALEPSTLFPDGQGYVVVTFASTAPTNCTVCGLAPGAEATLAAEIPEPGMFPLLLFASGVLVTVRRKICRR